MKNIEVVEVIVQAEPGATIWECQREAAIMALTEKRTVVLRHNAKEYVFKSDAVSYEQRK